ncbi:hypothetical protein Poli38472_010459 [Pythium oligandrum]|uniref:PDZ domain-containing protein n=1 Tax=Pythium oligandrum TaxID=41045 RepID=A0A8K1FDG9_PYTOL|nr:hypothetical protein Poli38472_010459 [Pythium oligandrum]|eukprot:TMW55577.1 hypothetical protein Poli38472_010459 [Pythium oligandrum]
MDTTSRQVGAPAKELARNLPQLVEQLKRLRFELEKSNRIYEAIASAPRGSSKLPSDEGVDERQSMYTPYPGSNRSDPVDDYGRASSMRYAPRPSSWFPSVQTAVDYTVMWVSGECGISLRNFSTNKIGAQIAVLQQAEGVTTGIANCRLGDQLVTVNDDVVEDFRFRDIVQKLKSTRRPITLGFRTSQNIATSPTSGGRMSSVGARGNSSRGVFGSEDELMALRGTEKFGSGEFTDRPTYSSVRSSTSTLSDDVELWCKEQEEMHSDVIMLVTETVMRCEKLQQENLDQLQNLMQLAPDMSDVDSIDLTSVESPLEATSSASSSTA